MEIKENQNQNRVKYAVAAVLSVVVFVILYKYALNEFKEDDIVDLREHL